MSQNGREGPGHRPDQPDLAQILLSHWKLLKSKDVAAYVAIHQAATGQFCDAYQEDLAEAAGMSVRHFHRAIKALEAQELIEVQQFFNQAEQRTKNRYILLFPENYQSDSMLSDRSLDQPDNMESNRSADRPDNMESDHSLDQPDSMLSDHLADRPDNMESDRSVDQSDSMLSDHSLDQPDNMLSDHSDQPDNMESGMMFMHDDDRYVGKKKEVLKLLDFLHEGERHKRARQKHVTVEFARLWRAWWEQREFGTLSNPAGFANAQIRKGHQPPAPQIHLPEGVLLAGPDPPNGHPPDAAEVAAALAEVGLTPQDVAAWQSTLADLERQMTRATFDSWLRGTCPLRGEPDTLVIGVRGEQAKQWIEGRLRQTIDRTAATNGLPPLRFEVLERLPLGSEVER